MLRIQNVELQLRYPHPFCRGKILVLLFGIVASDVWDEPDLVSLSLMIIGIQYCRPNSYQRVWGCDCTYFIRRLPVPVPY